MRRPLRKWLILAMVLLVAPCALLWAGYRATRHVPAFYDEAMRVGVAEQREAGHVMKRKATALIGDALRPGRWQAIFTQEQINGYLALDLVEKHPHLLPPQIRNPRVAIHRDALQIGWRYETRFPAAVYSLSLVPYMVSPNVLAVRIRHIRAGAIPVPLGQVVDRLSEAAREFDLRLEWRQKDGDPVALLHLPAAEDSAARRLLLESIELRDDALVLSGRTETPRDGRESATLILPGVHVADHADENEKHQ